MPTPPRRPTPGATFPAEVYALADAILAHDSHVNALRDAVADCPLDGKLHPLRNAIMRSSAWLLSNARELLKTRPPTRTPRLGPGSGPPAASAASDQGAA